MPPPPPSNRRAPGPTRASTSRTTPSSASTATRRPRGRPLLYTLAFAATTIMGTYYGAGLKMKSEIVAAQQEAKEKSVDEKIEALQGRRAALVKSLEDIEARINGIGVVKELGNGRGTG